MGNGVLASKKNVIILTVIVLAIVLMLSSYYAKQARIRKQTALGGQIELVSKGAGFPKRVFDFVNSHSLKNSYVVDLETTLTLPSGPFESNVRIIDWKYPIMGVMQIDNSQFKNVFSEDKKKRTEKIMETPPAAKGKGAKVAEPVEKIVVVVEKTFGVAVNQAFLDKTGMRIGETFKMNANNYQLRGVLQALPEDGGKKLMSEPLLCLKHFQVGGSNMYPTATASTYHYFVNKIANNSDWQANFKKSAPNVNVVINRWDS